MESYTFHVSIPGTGRTWRKVELTADQTLEHLHFAIQDAFDFGADHLYSFFMSGRAWDTSTEYALPEDADPWDADFGDDEFDDDEFDDDEFDDDEFDDDELDDDELEDEEIDDADLADEDLASDLTAGDADSFLEAEFHQVLTAVLGDGPAPESLDQMLNMVKDNAVLRDKLVKLLVAQTGVPAAMADLIFRNADKLSTLTPDQFAEQILATAPREVQTELLESMLFGDTPAGDVRTTTLAELDLKKGQKFLYLFDYGDEWRFNVRVHAVNSNADPSVLYPRLVEAVGEAPPQYSDWEDDEEWEDEDDEA